MFFEGRCQACDAIVEYESSRKDKDDTRVHADVDSASGCSGELKRIPYPRQFAVKWKYGPNDKEGCFMGPTNNRYRTDTTLKRDIAKTRTVTGPHYTGAAFKEKK